MLKKEHEILKPFAEKPWQKLTFKQIGVASKKKSKSYIFKTLKNFVKEGIIKKEKVGNVLLYSMNFSSMKALSCLGFVAEYAAFGRKSIPAKDLEKIASKIPTNFCILIVTGSYAKGEQKASSDLDLVILCEDSLDPNQIYSELRYDCEMNIPKIHLYVFTTGQFLKMLLDKKQNYGKEIAGSALIFSGAKEYLNIMKEAVKNGFNG